MPRAPTRHCGMPYVNLVCITYWKTWLKQGLKVAPARVNRALPEGDALEIMLHNMVSDDLQVSVDRLISELDKSVRLQVQSIPQRKYVSPIPNLLHRLIMTKALEKQKWQFYLAVVSTQLRYAISLIGVLSSHLFFRSDRYLIGRAGISQRTSP